MRKIVVVVIRVVVIERVQLSSQNVLMAVPDDAKVLRRRYRYAIGKERREFNAVAIERRAKMRRCRHVFAVRLE